MNFLDIIILVILGLAAISGFRKGLVMELTSLIALVLGVFVSMYFSEFMVDFLRTVFEIYDSNLHILAFIVTFALVVIIVNVIGKIVEKFVDILLLGIFNKIGGAFFAVLKGLFLLSLLIMVLNYFQFSQNWIKKEAKEKSKFYSSVESIVPFLYNHFDFFKELNRKLMNEEDKGVV